MINELIPIGIILLIFVWLLQNEPMMFIRQTKAEK